MRTHFSRSGWALLLFAVISVGMTAFSSKCIGLYLLGRASSLAEDGLTRVETSNDPQKLLAQANRLSWLFNEPKAEPLYARAEELFKAQGDARNEIYARVGRIRAQSETMSFENVSRMIGNELEQPAAGTDLELRLWCLAQKGYTDIEINITSAKKAWLDARALARSLREKEWEARAEGELGIIAFLEGDSKRAAAMVGHSFASEVATGDIGGQVRSLEMLGDGFNEVHRYGEALAFFNRAITIAHDHLESGFPYTAYEGKGLALAGQGKFDEAGRTLEYALAIARQSEKYGHQSQILIEDGEISMQTGNRRKAIDSLEKGGDLAQQHAFFRMAAQAMFDLAKIYRDNGDLRSAKDRATLGVDASRRVGDRYFLPRNLTLLADLKDREGNVAGAERMFSRAEEVIDGMLVNSNEAYWNSSLAEAMSETYLLHFELEARLSNIDRAFRVLESVRGRTPATLLENVGARDATTSKGVQKLETDVSTLQLQLLRSDRPAERAQLLDQLVEYERRLSWMQSDLDPAKPEWFDRPVPLARIRSRLRPDEMLLEYVLAEPQSFCLTISEHAEGIAVLPAGRLYIENAVREFLASIRARRNDVNLATRLYDILLRPISRQTTLDRLIIVPDGILHLLPFETLRDSSNPLLLGRTIVSYTPSSTVLYVLRNANNPRHDRRTLLALGDVPYQNQGNASAEIAPPRGINQRLLRGMSDLFGMRLYDLPETRAEVLDIKGILGGGTVLLGPNATETAFKSQPLADFKIVHLAAHGFSDSQFPERSGLVLGVDKASSDDGVLQVREIMGLRFDADLVALSACDTSVGKLQGEEGITDLAEAFLVRGAKSVVASLWSADDTFTHALMNQLYRHLVQGEDRASALRNAKLDLLVRYGKQLPPYYWAAFILTGDGSSPIPLQPR